MQNRHNYMKKSISRICARCRVWTTCTMSTMQESAQPLLNALTGNVTEVDISIDPAEPLLANGTVTISTEGASDTDMNAFPPEGVNGRHHIK